MGQPGKKLPWEDKLLRTGFFIGALLFHLILFALIATWVVFPSPVREAVAVTHFFIVPPPNPLPPPAPLPETPSVDASTAVPSAPVVVPSSPNISFKYIPAPIGLSDAIDQGPRAPEPMHPSAKGPDVRRLKKIRDFVEMYRTPQEIMTHDPAAQFPVYIASYADGDWACNTHLDADGNIVAGSIPNLVAKISEWSHGRIRGNVAAKPLNIGGPELLAQMPPFIFFTGHRDFVLTSREVENLREYVVDGGLIWGDNALAGSGSRFDVAFHREMKRVIPDDDKNFEPVAADADLFNKGWFPIAQIPQGMNYYAEPLEHLDLDGKLAILYTPNDYSDLCTMRILPGDVSIQGPRAEAASPLFTPGLFLSNRDVYFRNFTLPSSIAVNRLGMNIVAYLLTRFDDELLLSP